MPEMNAPKTLAIITVLILSLSILLNSCADFAGFSGSSNVQTSTEAIPDDTPGQSEGTSAGSAPYDNTTSEETSDYAQVTSSEPNESSEEHTQPVPPETTPDSTTAVTVPETSSPQTDPTTSVPEATTNTPAVTTAPPATTPAVTTTPVTLPAEPVTTPAVTTSAPVPVTTPPVTTVTTTPAKTEPPVDPVAEKDYSALNPASNQSMIIYEPNGGRLGSAFNSKTSISDTATHKITVTKVEDYFYQTVTDSYYLCPHAMGDKGYLARDGYVLYGYNTKADGTGTYYGCGWNVPVTEGQKIVLYAMWAKETPASDFVVSGSVISEYKGNDNVVVIPFTVNSMAITEIAARAFVNKNVTTVILHRGITKLNSFSFSNCPSLKEVYLYDKVTALPSDSFYSCPNFTTLYINNAQSIRYIGAQKEGSYHMKFQRLLLNKDKQKIMFVSGSNAVYGLLSPIIEKGLDNKYVIINYGTNYYVPSTIYIDLFSKFAKEGDIICILPEEVPQQWGDNQTTSGYAQFFPAVEGCMEVISYLDIRNYMNMLPYIAKYNGNRAGGGNSYESVWSEAVDDHGDFSYVRTEPKTGKWSNTALQDWFGPSYRETYFSDYNVSNLNRAFDACVNAGAKVYISFSIVDKDYVSDYSESNLKAYEDAVTASYITGHTGRYLISHVSDYIFEHSAFYNSMHHILTEPSKERSELLLRDIKAQLAKE